EVQHQLKRYESTDYNDHNLILNNSTSGQTSSDQILSTDQTLSDPTDEFLKSWEWDLLDQLIELFRPIEEAMEWLSGQKYCTLSLIFPTIQVLKCDYIIIGEEDNEDITKEASDYEETEDKTVEEETEEEGINNDTDSEEVDEPTRPNIDKTIKLVKNTIYNALFKYFDNLPDSALLASLLGPRFKKMKG
ncbi:16253_t:CDS:2, partial [Dentiscutata heterogama]